MIPEKRSVVSGKQRRRIIGRRKRNLLTTFDSKFFAAVQNEYSGPLPPPEMLRQFEQICPGLTAKLIEIQVKESNHRRSMEEKALDAEISLKNKAFAERRLGQVFGFIIAMTGIVGGFVVISKGFSLAGGIVSVTSFTALVSMFLYGRKENAAKNKKNSKS